MTSGSSPFAERLTLGVYQFAPKLRDVPANLTQIDHAARTAAVDVLVTPELSVTGYDLRDGVHDFARPLSAGATPRQLWGVDEVLATARNILVGAVERGEDTVPYNAALLFDRGQLIRHQRKVYPPTYGMFDEGRYFGRGRRLEPFVVDGWRLGVLICEDFWHPVLAYLHALQRAHALLIMAAAPGRGVWQGGEDGAFFGSSDAWERIARCFAQLYGVYVVVCNRCGVEGGVTFAGESIVVAPDASVIARASTDEQLLRVNLNAAEVTAARTPYAHVRDEDIDLALRELQRIAVTR